jgi:hypothetical protein
MASSGDCIPIVLLDEEPVVREMTGSERRAMEELTLEMHQAARKALDGRPRRFPILGFLGSDQTETESR